MSTNVTKNVKTFEFDQSLPVLPLPDLESSLLKYLNSIEFLLTPNEYQDTINSIKEFKSNIGDLLQNKLEEKAKTIKNWMEQIWLNNYYLKTRQPLIPNSVTVIPFTLNEFWQNNLNDFNELTYRISLVTRVQLEFWNMLREQDIKPMFHKNQYWSMNQFKHLFDCTRLPGLEKDEITTNYFQKYDKNDLSSDYIICLYNNRIFQIKVYDKENLIVFSLNQLKEQFLAVFRNKKYETPGDSVSCLTLNDRKSWFENRNKLIDLNDNKKTLEIIEKSLFVIAIENDCPLNKTEIFSKTLVSQNGQRWADKSINTVYFKNGTLGLIGHDNFTLTALTNFMYSKLKTFKGAWPNILISHSEDKHNFSSAGFVKELDFSLNSYLKDQITLSKEIYLKNTNNVNVAVKSFYAFGKQFLKKNHLHPEGLIQLAINLAYYKLKEKNSSFNLIDPTCSCIASTRKFYNGRTDVCRTFSKEFQQFSTHTILNQKFDKVHYQLLKNAVGKFQVLMNDASNGNGIDRHFLSLESVCKELKLTNPSFFETSIYKKYGPKNNYVLNTSNYGLTSIVGGSIPLIEQGYSIFYSIEETSIHFTTLDFKDCPSTDSVLLFTELNNALLNIQTILTKASL